MKITYNYLINRSLLMPLVFRNFSPIVVPLQSSMTVTLPSGAGSHHDHNPFPGSMACIIGFEDTVSSHFFKTCHSVELRCVQTVVDSDYFSLLKIFFFYF